jgi:hypothetical protein
MIKIILIKYNKRTIIIIIIIICKALGIEMTNGTHVYTHTHTHTTKPVCGQKGVTMLQNQRVHTDTEITVKRPDIIIKTKKEKTCMLIDVAIPTDRNVMQMEVEKKL